MGKRIDTKTIQLAMELSKFNCDENDCENCPFSGENRQGVYCDDLFLADKLIKDGYTRLSALDTAILKAAQSNDLYKVIRDNREAAIINTAYDILTIIKSQGEYPELVDIIKHRYGV